MGRLVGLRVFMGIGVLSVLLVFGVSGALAAFHGIAVSKGCTSPVQVGDPYTCSVQIQNIVDTGHDTLQVTGLTDVVNSAGGAVPPGVPPNILPTTGLVFSGAVSCTGGSGAGTSASPYLGATSCLLPFGTSITTKPFSHYTVQAADFNLPNHRLTDTASVAWHNTCTLNPDNDCTTGPQVAGAGSSALVIETVLTGNGRITGGGSIFATVNGTPNVRVTHGLELRCDPTDKRQSLEINWDGGNNFHLDKIINSVICFDDPTTQPPPPPGTVVDTYAGNTMFNGQSGYHGFGYAVGTGTCNKQPATIYFILIDAGEPGTEDIAEYHIVSSGCTLDAGPAQLLKGNHQFHKN
jgi:hypothetical protein